MGYSRLIAKKVGKASDRHISNILQKELDLLETTFALNECFQSVSRTSQWSRLNIPMKSRFDPKKNISRSSGNPEQRPSICATPWPVTFNLALVNAAVIALPCHSIALPNEPAGTYMLL